MRAISNILYSVTKKMYIGSPMQSSERQPSQLASLLFFLAASLLGIATVTNMFTNYMGIKIIDSISFNVADGWCNSKTEGFGLHCFGDFSQLVFFDESIDPYEMKTNVGLSPISAPMSTVFSIFGFAFGKQIALWVYLSILALSYLSVYIWAVKKYPFKYMAAYVLVLGAATVPFMSTIDRGNNFGLALPGICLIAICFWEKKVNLALIFIVLTGLVKPQYLILILPFLFSINWLKSITALASWASIVFCLFIIYPNPQLRFQEWIKGFAGYTNYSPLGYDAYFTTNVAWVNGINQNLVITTSSILSRFEIHKWLDEYRFQITISLCLTLLFFWIVARKKMHPIYSMFILAIVATFTSSTTAVYYLGVTSVLAIVFIAKGSELISELGKVERIFTWLAVPLIALSISPLVIPTFGVRVESGRVNNYLSLLSPLLWLLWSLVLMISVLIVSQRNAQSTKNHDLYLN